MGAFSALREFFGRSEHAFAPMDDPFVQIDRAVVAEKLELRRRGSENGALNLPGPDMEALDNVEADVVGFIVDHYSRAQIDAANNLRTYDGRLAGLTLLTKVTSIKSTAVTAVSDFKAEVLNSRNALSNRRDAIASSYAELRDFRREHGLKRPAHAVPAHHVSYSAIGVSWLFEAALNSFLLRQNDSMGLLGGVMSAAAISAINVVVAAGVGRQVWPQTARANPLARMAAWAGIFGWVLFLVAWNLLAAHYRDAKSLNLLDPERQALGMMWQGLDSIYSWALLIAGLVFAIISAFAGYRMDDPYPGYGPVTRRHDARCEDYADEVRAASEELLGIRNDAVSDAVSVRSALEQQMAEREQILTARAAFVRRFGEFGSQLEQTANALLQEYRVANLAARTAPAPRHFNQSWTLPRAALPEVTAPAVDQAAITAAEAAVDQATVEIAAAFDEAVSSFEPLDALKARLYVE